ncbi:MULTISPECIES: TetR/AcrR family transcriptional regulator [Erwinia]|uniref:TetR/AcrR family transcriptional regulator n=1 Tax=Erwinia TaxID=551 RepID=UPI0010CF2784|nr:TetR/AcrR family transcriptional regulator [Erwinia aphidicola]MCP2231102.1 AcrR family transcriptional regulator [Erwinia aphidicola]VTT34998.1 transcriptional regulator [Klebsiella pneumoniae]
MKSSQSGSSAGETPSCQRGWHRKKQPEQVRAALIQCAAELAARQGLSGVTVQAVSDAAGVTKGGFFHHFPHKQALLDAVFDAFMAEREQEIDALMAADPHPGGRFTRAYITTAFEEMSQRGENIHIPLSLSMMASPALCQRWNAWLAGRLQQHQLTDSHPLHEVARLATDGAWLSGSLEVHSAVRDAQILKNHLLALTRESEPS